ncbi:hypothetical protein ABW20_dc0109471 [Dactylellina cionopaga]|nr:hypothetical protein ABW20_dc0109471 [Dactylellina cionopaga]
MASSISQIYKNYIQAINDRDWQLLTTIIHSEVTWNHNLYPAEDYIGLITRSTIPAPDLRFNIDVLVADENEQRVAVRLLIRGTPKDEFLGFQPNGKAVEIVEHAFYKFEEGKVREVRTIIDMDGLRQQMDKRLGA